MATHKSKLEGEVLEAINNNVYVDTHIVTEGDESQWVEYTKDCKDASKAIISLHEKELVKYHDWLRDYQRGLKDRLIKIEDSKQRSQAMIDYVKLSADSNALVALYLNREV